jgi:SAM-dependent methyltransferase
MKSCRSCGAPLDRIVLDLGSSPLANNYPTPEEADRGEVRYPLRMVLCEGCGLAQLDFDADPVEIFEEYSYFSSYSASWLAHAGRLVDTMTERLGLDGTSLVIEIASNDGYLLRQFQDRDIAVLGVEPARNVAAYAQSLGVPTVTRFFGQATAEGLVVEGRHADLLVANNVMAHVPDLDDFVAGLATLLAPEGVVSIEFPHVRELLRYGQFDTIYHEHFSYLSLRAVERVLGAYGLRVFDVERLPTHGGSLRVLACHGGSSREPAPGLALVRELELASGVVDGSAYDGIAVLAERCRADVMAFLTGAVAEGKVVVGYGAAAKGVTFLNYCGIGPELVRFVADVSPHKQGRLIPGTGIPIEAPEAIDELRPDYVLVLAWNLIDEISAEMARINDWGGAFVVAMPELQTIVRIDHQGGSS